MIARFFHSVSAACALIAVPALAQDAAPAPVCDQTGNIAVLDRMAESA